MPYTDTQRAEALDVYQAQGLAEAHKRTGIPRATLRLWAKKAGLDPAALSVHTQDKTKAANEAWRTALAKDRLKLQAEMMDAALHHVAKSKRRDITDTGAKERMLAMAVAVDKLRLELGEVTDRTESRTVDAVTAEVEALALKLKANDPVGTDT